MSQSFSCLLDMCRGCSDTTCGCRCHRPQRPGVVFIWETDDICTIMLGEKKIITVDHDNHGFDGMGGVIDAVTRFAELQDIEITIQGVPNL